jgi:hypothetical protein
MTDDERAEIMADNMIAVDELRHLTLEIRRTLSNPRECWRHVEQAAQKMTTLNVNVRMLMEDSD